MTHAPSSPPRPPAAPAPVPPRRTAWAENAGRLRRAATTEPGRLRIIGAALAALVLAFGAQAAWQVSDRAGAADAVIDSSQPLSADAASVYRSLADADTTAAAAFLAGGDEPPELRERYERDIRTASRLLAKAAADNGGSARSHEEIAELNEQLPVYTGLVETARANNRQGLPLGGAYLRHASERMREEMLPAAEALYRSETARLRADYEDARAWPVPALLTGTAALAALGWAQRRHYLRTNRVFSPGLLAATAATAAGLLWLAAGHGIARSCLGDSDRHGARSLQALNEAWAGVLQARGDESLTLVARGGGALYEESYRRGMREVLGDGGSRGGAGGQLGRALALADDEAGRGPVEEAVRSAAHWRERHAAARALENSGRYDDAVALVIQPGGNTVRGAFDAVDAALSEAVRHEQREFERAAEGGRGVLGGLPAGVGALAVLGAAGVVLGVGRRLAEYR
ncbi:hypothetical protein [Streptomyces sp. DH37]|uniref:hypothetical protein n=1 Tax=Streptomyces sp. DH37 TaxID=3040122 RepID=UPI00244358E8|nr:hypothetical protein [Streptomyces sp. DH37]MDG9702046.1 hypothetical protein [Streptomyces sp. DH37]